MHVALLVGPGGLGAQEREKPHDSPARKRSISGSGDDAALRVRLYLRVEAREVLYS